MPDQSTDLLRFGCPLNNLVQEMDPVDKGFKRRLQAALNLWIDRTEELLRQAQVDGFLKANINPRDVAYFVVMAHEGFYGLIKGLGRSGAYDALLSSLQIYFQAIAPSDGTR